MDIHAAFSRCDARMRGSRPRNEVRLPRWPLHASHVWRHLGQQTRVTMVWRPCSLNDWARPPPAKATRTLLLHMCLNACRWHNRKDWNALIRNGMTSDLSWDRAAKDYEQIFSWALMDPPQA